MIVDSDRRPTRTVRATFERADTHEVQAKRIELGGRWFGDIEKKGKDPTLFKWTRKDLPRSGFTRSFLELAGHVVGKPLETLDGYSVSADIAVHDPDRNYPVMKMVKTSDVKELDTLLEETTNEHPVSITYNFNEQKPGYTISVFSVKADFHHLDPAVVLKLDVAGYQWNEALVTWIFAHHMNAAEFGKMGEIDVADLTQQIQAEFLTY
jgi:hypothetical protein